MRGFLQVHRPGGVELVPLAAARVMIGRSSSNDIVVGSDPKVSRLHAVLEELSAGWCVRDLNARSGTFVNGGRLYCDRTLLSGDEVRVGSTRFFYRAARDSDTAPPTEGPKRAPELTRERVMCCWRCSSPRSRGEVFAEPAPTRDIAVALSVSEAAVKQHLLHLYDKFGINEGDRPRVRLANEVLNRGAVSLADVRNRRE